MSRALGAVFAFLVSGVVPLLAVVGGILFLSGCGSCDSTVRQAVVAPTGTAAASSKLRVFGLRASFSTGAVVYSAYVPFGLWPKTACPF